MRKEENIKQWLLTIEKIEQHVFASDIINTEFSNAPYLTMLHIEKAWQLFSTLAQELSAHDNEQIKELSNQLNATFQDKLADFSKVQSDFEVNPEDSTLPDRICRGKSYLQKTAYKLKLSFLKLQGWKPWYKKTAFLISIAIIILSVVIINLRHQYHAFRLGFKVISHKQDWGSLQFGKSVDGNALNIEGQKCSDGLGTHANSTIIIRTYSGKKNLQGICGLDTEQGAGSITCEIRQNDKTLFASPMLTRSGTNSVKFNVAVDSDKPVYLIVGNADNNSSYDHADWCNLKAY